jgi:hypothetical protein
MKINAIAASVAVLSVLVLPGRADGQTTVYLSQPSRVGARALGFAGAVASDNPDVTVMTVNPSALSYLESSDIIVSHLFQNHTEIMEENVAIPLFLRKGEVVGIALSVNHVGYATTSFATQFKVMQYGYDVSYARRISPTFSIGGTLHVRYAQSEDDKLWGLSSAFGMFYFPIPNVSYGLSLTGVGKGIKYIYTGETTKLNDENIPRSLHAGSTFRWPSLLGSPRFLTLTVEAEKNLERSGVMYYGGFEIIPSKFAALRIGYFGVANGPDFPSYGVTVKMAGWKLDIGGTPGKQSPQQYQATLSVPLWNQFDEIY